jgi:hypothetical protein
MVSRPSLPMVLVGVGIVLLIIAAVPIGGSGSTDTDYVHRVEPATNGTLAYGLEYDTNDVLSYENLSEPGQTVFNRAHADSPYVIENESDTVPDFTYTTDNIAVGHGLYPIRYSGTTYSIQTVQEGGGFNAAAWFFSLLFDAFRVLGIILIVVGALLVGWRRYSR